nr:PREDICTED: lipoxygenase homology domain-containing protein 1-like [Anolis carolinensis]|eukprot:XP_016847213.1 PREDICTED: lipoxygenase homology domain-containing protein 1-like [Anolis carolinensis]
MSVVNNFPIITLIPSPPSLLNTVINYEVCVATGDVRNAGTNANVFMQIYGELGKTELLILKNRSNNYERGASETFRVEAVDVGKVYKIRIGHDGKGFGDGWFLDSVVVKKLPTKVPKKKKKKKKKKTPEEEEAEEGPGIMEVYNFTPCRWLASDEEDKELVVELVPDEGSELEGKLGTFGVM